MKLALICLGLLTTGALVQALSKSCELPNCEECIDYLPQCMDCPDGTAQTDDLMKCIECPTNCYECIAPTESQLACTECLSGFFIEAAGTCTSCGDNCEVCASTTTCETCDSGYFLDIDTGMCVGCPSRCASCSNGDSCTLCNADSYKDANGACKSCPANAAACSYNAGQDVVKVSSCDGKFVKNEDEDACLSCPDECSSCVLDGTDAICSSCNTAYFLDGDVCTSCVGFCDDCPDDVECTTCREGYSVAPDGVNTCSACGIAHCTDCSTSDSVFVTCSACESGWFLENNACSQCEPLCDTCTNTTVCTACKDPDTQALSTTSVPGDMKCFAIPPNCESIDATGASDAAVCDVCKPGFSNDNGTHTQCDSMCDVANCASCNTSATCDACKDNYGLQQIDAVPNLGCLALSNCLSLNLTAQSATPVCETCNDGYYLAAPLCTKCPLSKCKACDTTTPFSCSVCLDGYKLNAANDKCEACVDDCKSCSDLTTCATCEDGFGLTDSSTCSACSEYCIDCAADVNVCVQCDVDNFPDIKLIGGACVFCPDNCAACSLNADEELVCDNCMAGYTVEPDSGSCTPCPLLCDVCDFVDVDGTDQLSCTTCSDGYGTNSHVCTNCPSNCRTCGYAADRGNVCSQCKSGFTVVNGLCEACPSNCLTCSSPTTCSECSNGYGLNWKKTACVECPELTDIDNCMLCNDHPPYENDTTTCTSCSFGYYLKDNIGNHTDVRAECLEYTTEPDLACGDGVLVVDEPPMCLQCELRFNLLNGRCGTTCFRCGDPRVGSWVAADQCITDNSTGNAMFDHCEDGTCYSGRYVVNGAEGVVMAGCHPGADMCEEECSDQIDQEDSETEECSLCCTDDLCNDYANDLTAFDAAAAVSSSLATVMLSALLLLTLK